MKTGLTLLRIAAAGVILYGIWLMMRITVPYTSFDPYWDFLLTKQLVYHIRSWRISFYVHVFLSTFVLIAGLLQFVPSVLRQWPGVHRVAGRTYAGIVLFLSGPSGLVMSFYANGGIRARTSFVIVSVLWLAFTAMGWRLALKRQWEAHAEMMLRSYALALSALSLRFYAFLLAFSRVEMHPVTSYILVSWLSWTLNLLLAEILIRSGVLKRWMGTGLPHA